MNHEPFYPEAYRKDISWKFMLDVMPRLIDSRSLIRIPSEAEILRDVLGLINEIQIRLLRESLAAVDANHEKAKTVPCVEGGTPA